MKEQNSKLAIFFPGVGYNLDKPLFHYSRKLLSANDYEPMLMPYTGLANNMGGATSDMEGIFCLARDKCRSALQESYFFNRKEILLVGKSVGTVVAASLYGEISKYAPVKMILFTPVEKTFEFDFSNSICFTGSNDPWVGDMDIVSVCNERNMTCYQYQDANHSLETEDIFINIKYLENICQKIFDFVN